MDGMVDLGSQLESFVDQLVQEGRYASRDEVLREGVRALKERDAAQWLSELDASIHKSIASAEAGRVHDLDAAAERLSKSTGAWRRRAAPCEGSANRRGA